MDPITTEKFQAMKNYKRTNFYQSLFQYRLTSFVFGLCFSIALPSLCDSLNLFFCTLPKISALFFAPKCLFIVCNMIVIFLVGESKLTGSSPSSPTSDIYNEYVKHSQCAPRFDAIEGKAKEKKLEVPLPGSNVEMIKEVVEEVQKEAAAEDKKEKEEQEQEQDKEEKKKGGVELNREEDFEFPADELNKRIEDFFARVNRQRRLEAKMLVCRG